MKITILLLFVSTLCQASNFDKISSNKFLFENEPLIIDRVYFKINKCALKDISNQYKFDGKDNTEYICIARFDCEVNKFVLLRISKGRYDFFVTGDKFNYNEENFISIAQFSEYTLSYDIDYACVFDKSGNYVMYNPLFGGYISEFNCQNTPFTCFSKLNDESKISNCKIEGIEWLAQFINDTIEISLNSILAKGFLPLNLFVSNKMIDSIQRDNTTIYFVNASNSIFGSIAINYFTFENKTNSNFYNFGTIVVLSNGEFDIIKKGLVKISVSGIDYSSIPIEKLSSIW